jgi:hypothetical protein
MYHLQKKAFEDDIISIKNRLFSIEIENNKLKERTNTQEDENTKLKQRVNALEEELESYKNENEAWKEEEEEGYDEINEKIISIINTNNKLTDDIQKIKETQEKQEIELSTLDTLQSNYDKNISEGIKTFATKETIDEIKNVTIANKRNILAIASIWAQFLPNTNINKYDVVKLSKMINKRRKEIRDYVYKGMYREGLKYKSLDELRKIALENSISEVDILDAIESPDDKEHKNGYEGDMDEEYDKQNKKVKSKDKKTSHDNLRDLIINEKIKKIVYPKDQYRYRKVDDLERRFFYNGYKLGYCENGSISNNIKKMSGKLDSEEINRFPNSYNEGFTDEGGYDDY